MPETLVKTTRQMIINLFQDIIASAVCEPISPFAGDC